MDHSRCYEVYGSFFTLVPDLGNRALDIYHSLGLRSSILQSLSISLKNHFEDRVTDSSALVDFLHL